MGGSFAPPRRRRIECRGGPSNASVGKHVGPSRCLGGRPGATFPHGSWVGLSPLPPVGKSRGGPSSGFGRQTQTAAPAPVGASPPSPARHARAGRAWRRADARFIAQHFFAPAGMIGATNKEERNGSRNRRPQGHRLRVEPRPRPRLRHAARRGRLRGRGQRARPRAARRDRGRHPQARPAPRSMPSPPMSRRRKARPRCLPPAPSPTS